MKMMEIQVEVSGIDDWDHTIKPYIRKMHNHVKYNEEFIIGADVLKNIDTKQIEIIVHIFNTYNRDFNCDECQDWGCINCCDSSDKIRSRQGIFS